MRPLDPPASSLVVLGGLAYALFEQGAYHEQPHRLFSVVVLLGALLLVSSRRERRAALASVIIVAPMLASSVVSVIASTDRSDARSTMLLLALVAAGLAAGSAAQERGRRTVEATLVSLAGVVSVTAIVGVALQEGPWGRLTGDVWRGSSSLTYSNAAAGIAGPIALFAFVRAVDERSRAHAIASTGLLLGVVATQSRGGALALLVVGTVVVARRPARDCAAAGLPIVVGVGGGAPFILLGSQTPSPIASGVVLVAAVAALAVTAWVWSRTMRLERPMIAAGLVAIGSTIIAIVAGSTLFERFTLRSGTTAQGPDAEVLFGDRASEWAAAWEQVLEKPVLGHGPGVVELMWTEDGRTFEALFVHNEYLELMVTHGFVGLAALAVAVRFAYVRAVPDLAIAGALAAFLLHSSVDFLWHLPALPVFFAVLTGTLIDPNRGTLRRARTDS